MNPSSPRQLLFRQGGSFIAVGLAQLLLDWLVFVGLTALGVPAASGNLAGRISGALLGFWLNGRVTFARSGEVRLGWWRFVKFLLVWIPLTVISTLQLEFQGSLVRGTINPQRQPAGNYKTGPGQAAGKGCGCIQTWP